jgi:hypothetical protein
MRLPWVHASGDPATLSLKAAMYLKRFDHKMPAHFDFLEMTLAKVVSNLRTYYLQDANETVRLIQSLFNPRTTYKWSPEGIRLAWDSVAGFTPSLGLSDIRALAMKRKRMLEYEVADLLASTLPYGRIPVAALLAEFNDRNPDFNARPKEFGMAVKTVSGLSSVGYQGVRHYPGVSLPRAGKEKGSNAPSEDVSAAVKPSAQGSQMGGMTAPPLRTDLGLLLKETNQDRLSHLGSVTISTRLGERSRHEY